MHNASLSLQGNVGKVIWAHSSLPWFRQPQIPWLFLAKIVEYLKAALGEREQHSDTKNCGSLFRESGTSQWFAEAREECLAQE